MCRNAQSSLAQQSESYAYGTFTVHDVVQHRERHAYFFCEDVTKVYPKAISSYVMYEDDGESYAYEEGAIAATHFECTQKGNRIAFTVYPVEGFYKGMYESHTYEQEIVSPRRPEQVSVNGRCTDDWLYGEDGKIRICLHQPDVKEKAEVVCE